jgi:2-amino-4-hydroxy-6-hydroxymethyldihydropteridine diphosphokinase
MSWAVLGLGTNLGARRAMLESAIALLGPRVLARSALYATPPLGPPQPDYLNAAVRVLWDDTPELLLALAHEVEAKLGRERRVRWGPRTLDVDILHWSEGDHHGPQLRVPHPELCERSFALAPLLDVAPELAELRPRLAVLGGPPARANPGWSAWVHEGDALCGEWLRDESELAAQLVALLVKRTSAVSAHTLDVQPFHGPHALLDGDGPSWLELAARAAWASGFAVRGCAVFSRDLQGTRGVLLGVSGLHEAPPAALQARLERSSATEGRWTVPLGG